MTVTIKTKTLEIEREVLRYALSTDTINVSLSGGRLEKTPKNGDIATVEITDEVNGNVTLTTQFVSYNFIVYENPQSGEVSVIGDNTLLFRILDL